MQQKQKFNSEKRDTFYLSFMFVACCGALIWQIFFPELAEKFSVWGTAYGWQREIAIWNAGLILSIAYACLKRKKEFMKILTLQSALLCLGLGFNHLITLFNNFALTNIIHILGVLEVMLLGGIWGIALLIRPCLKNREDCVKSTRLR